MSGPLWLATLTGLARAMPLGGGAALAGTLSLAHGRIARRRRDIVRRNLAEFGRPVLEPDIDGVFRNYGRFFFEFLRGPENPDIRFDAENLELLDRALARGRGVVLALPHTGNWEIAGTRLARRGHRVTSVAGVQLREEWMQEIRRRRLEAGIHIVSVSREGVRAMEAALRDNGVVALHVDGDLFRKGVAVRIGGRTVEFPTGPAKLAARNGAALLFGYCERIDGGFQRGRVVKEIALSGTSPQSVQRATSELAQAFEEAVGERLHEWLMFRDFFGESPQEQAESSSWRAARFEEAAS
ncbi:MAG TPA: lysophospholipid acyltransferase family protein [bacterium]|nr:lysophospholipid acyltransferase family protein [bacterium]